MRADRLFEAAVSGLFEYYTCLTDGTLVGEFRAAVRVPDTGNDQADYENVRNQVERLCKQQPFGGNDPGLSHPDDPTPALTSKGQLQ